MVMPVPPPEEDIGFGQNGFGQPVLRLVRELVVDARAPQRDLRLPLHHPAGALARDDILEGEEIVLRHFDRERE